MYIYICTHTVFVSICECFFFLTDVFLILCFVQYPVSFALNLAIPPDKVLGTRHVYMATKGLNNLKEMGGKGDEADTAKLKVSHCFNILFIENKTKH